MKQTKYAGRRPALSAKSPMKTGAIPWKIYLYQQLDQSLEGEEMGGVPYS